MKIIPTINKTSQTRLMQATPLKIASVSVVALLFSEYITTRRGLPYKPSVALGKIRTFSEDTWEKTGVLVAKLGSFLNLINVDLIKKELNLVKDSGLALVLPVVGTLTSAKHFFTGYVGQIKKYVEQNWNGNLVYVGTGLLALASLALSTLLFSRRDDLHSHLVSLVTKYIEW